MKSLLQGVTLKRFLKEGFGQPRESQSRVCKTWEAAGVLAGEWAADRQTRDNFVNSILVRPRWKNGLVLHEFGFSKYDAQKIRALGLGNVLRDLVEVQYGRNKRLRSSKAVLAREVLARCSFQDGEGNDGAEDARTLDVVTRALEQMYPDTAAVYIARVKSWMTNGGGVR